MVYVRPEASSVTLARIPFAALPHAACRIEEKSRDGK